MGVCTETTRLTLSPYDKDKPDVICFRPVDENGRHVGDHQGFDVFMGRPGDPTGILPSMREPIESCTRLVTWSWGGAQSQTYHPDRPNTNCGCKHPDRNRTGHQPEDHHWDTCAACGIIADFKAPGPQLCFGCALWRDRAKSYARGWVPTSTGRRTIGRFVREEGSDHLYGWSDGSSGAFGGRQAKVTWNDGDTRGPADSLWSSGKIPWWLDENFPPNGTIEWVS